MELISILKFVAALVFVVSSMVLLAWLAKRYGVAGAVQARTGKRRLQIMEQLALDSRRRVVLLRRDDVAHLVITGGSGGDVVVETGIDAAEADNVLEIVKETAA